MRYVPAFTQEEIDAETDPIRRFYKEQANLTRLLDEPSEADDFPMDDEETEG